MMKKLIIALVATAFATTPALAKAEDWWLVAGEPGAAKVEFIDAASINRSGASVSFEVATYWNNGHKMERELTMNCNTKPDAAVYSELWNFACGSQEMRMSSGLMLGQTKPEWLAKTVFSMPS